MAKIKILNSLVVIRAHWSSMPRYQKVLLVAASSVFLTGFGFYIGAEIRFHRALQKEASNLVPLVKNAGEKELEELAQSYCSTRKQCRKLRDILYSKAPNWEVRFSEELLKTVYKSRNPGYLDRWLHALREVSPFSQDDNTVYTGNQFSLQDIRRELVGCLMYNPNTPK